MSYQDSGFSEEDPDHHVTTCLMKTPSGSIYIQPTSELGLGLTQNTRSLLVLTCVQFLLSLIDPIESDINIHCIGTIPYSALSGGRNVLYTESESNIFDSSRIERLGSVPLGGGES